MATAAARIEANSGVARCRRQTARHFGVCNRPMRELEDQQRKGEVTRYCERATLLEKELSWWKTRVFGRTAAQHHSSEVSVDQKMLFSETEVFPAMESAEYVFARRLFGDHLGPPVCTSAPEMEIKENTFQPPSAQWVSLARDRWVRYPVGDAPDFAAYRS